MIYVSLWELEKSVPERLIGDLSNLNQDVGDLIQICQPVSDKNLT